MIAYNKIPDFKIKESDLDDYPMIIEINKELVKNKINKETEINNVKIFEINQTIYLHPREVKFLFFSEKHKDVCLLKSEQSIETKLLRIYENGIKVINNNHEFFKWNSKFVDKISDADINIFQQILSDSKINKLKGFYYSYLLGMTFSNILTKRKLKDKLRVDSNLYIKKFNIKCDEGIIDEFIDELKDIKEKLHKNESPLLLKNGLNFNGYKITQLADNFFENKDDELYRNIINELLEYDDINDVQKFKEEKVNIAYSIGEVLKDYSSEWENSNEQKYLNSLLDNIEQYKPFNLKSHSSILLQSIALFIQKGEEPEKLIESLKKEAV